MGGVIFTEAGWTGAAIEYEHDLGVDTYTVASDRLNGYDVLTALALWLDDAARPWAADIDSVTLTRAADTTRAQFAFAYTGNTPSFASVTPNATWQSKMGAAGMTPQASVGSTPGTLVWARWDMEEGARSRDGSWRMGHPVASHRRPTCEIPMGAAQRYAFNDAIRRSSQPRKAYVFDELTQTWRFVTVGQHEVQELADDATLAVATLQILGGM